MPIDPPADQLEQAPAIHSYRWYHKAAALLLVIFCLEVGVVLLILPWSDYWDNNFFATWIPGLRGLWANTYLRGAVSGLGVANVVIAFGELFRLRRFSSQPRV